MFCFSRRFHYVNRLFEKDSVFIRDASSGCARCLNFVSIGWFREDIKSYLL